MCKGLTTRLAVVALWHSWLYLGADSFGTDGVGEEQGAPRAAHDVLYDYVIVGSGAAGAVLSERLSRSAGKRVLLVEGGGPSMRSLPGGGSVGLPPAWSSFPASAGVHAHGSRIRGLKLQAAVLLPNPLAQF